MTTNKNAKRYRLASSELVNTPGIIAWAINGYRFKEDRARLVELVTETYKGVTKRAARRLLSGEVEYTETEDGVVEFTA